MPGATRISAWPLASAEIVPALLNRLPPDCTTAWPICPAPRMVLPAPTVTPLPPSTYSREPVPPSTICPPPKKLAPVVRASKLRAVLLLTLTTPALLSVLMACAVLTVTVLPAPITAVSAPPGTPPGLPLPATQFSQLASAFQLPLAVFQVQVAALAGCAAPASSAAVAAASAWRRSGC